MAEILKDLLIGWVAFMSLITLLGMAQAVGDFVGEQGGGPKPTVFAAVVVTVVLVLICVAGGFLRGWL